MLHHYIKSVLLLSLIASLLSCEKMLEHEYSVKTVSFDSVHKYLLYHNINAEFIQSDQNRIEIKAPVDLIDDIHVDTLDRSIRFKNKNKSNWRYYRDSILATIYYKPPLYEIRTEGTGYIKIRHLDQKDHFNLLVFNGSGEVSGDIQLNSLRLITYTSSTTDVNLSGNCANLTAYINGTGRVDLREMEALYTKSIHRSTNNHYLYVSSYLDVEFQSIGKYYLKGRPVIVYNDTADTEQIISLEKEFVE